MINFTQEHLQKLSELALKMLFTNGEIRNRIGTSLSIVELLHTTSINQLNEIKAILAKKIEQQESRDEWIDPDNEKLTKLKEDKELVNLIVGWKRLNLERAENARKKEELTKKLAELKESTKTPEDRIKEMEAELAKLEEF
jgi:hypothetical protein